MTDETSEKPGPKRRKGKLLDRVKGVVGGTVIGGAAVGGSATVATSMLEAAQGGLLLDYEMDNGGVVSVHHRANFEKEATENWGLNAKAIMPPAAATGALIGAVRGERKEEEETAREKEEKRKDRSRREKREDAWLGAMVGLAVGTATAGGMSAWETKKDFDRLAADKASGKVETYAKEQQRRDEINRKMWRNAIWPPGPNMFPDPLKQTAGPVNYSHLPLWGKMQICNTTGVAAGAVLGHGGFLMRRRKRSKAEEVEAQRDATDDRSGGRS